VAEQPTFYFDLSSPYAYLAAERIDSVLPVAPRWQPIAFGALIRARGKVPWSLDPRTRDGGMREVEERVRDRGLPAVRWPPGWPQRSYSLLPLRAVLAARASGRHRELTMALYRTAFVSGRALNDPHAVAGAVAEVGLDVDEVMAGAQDPAIKAELREATDRAQEQGVTGVPTVVVDGRLFWGDDRLEDAARALA